VITGDARDPATAAQVVDSADAVVSAIGGTRPGNLAVLQEGTAAILRAMQVAGVRRLIVIQGFHLPFPGDPGNRWRGRDAGDAAPVEPVPERGHLPDG
jgi:hypothetical protein